MKSESPENNSIVYWLLFEVVIPLAPLYLLIPVAFFLTREHWQWSEIVADGSLLLYATTIASKATGEHFPYLDSPRSKWFSICVLIIIVMLSSFIYALIVMTNYLNFDSALSPKRVALMSTGIAICSLIFSFALRLRTRLPKGYGYGVSRK